MTALKLINFNEVKLLEAPLVEKGKKGVTNKQMIPALVGAIEDTRNTDWKLNTLYDNHEKVFMSAAKYVPDKMKLTLERFIVEKGNEGFQLPIGKKLRYQLEDQEIEKVKLEIVKPQLKISEEFKSKNNEKLALIVTNNENWKKDLNEEEIEMVKLAIQDLSTTEIGSKFEYSKDKVYTLLFRNNGKSVINKLGA